VVLIDINLHLVHVLLDIMNKMKNQEIVEYVIINVLIVIHVLPVVSNVLLTESVYQNVSVQLVTLIMVLKIVKLVLLNVPNVHLWTPVVAVSKIIIYMLTNVKLVVQMVIGLMVLKTVVLVNHVTLLVKLVMDLPTIIVLLVTTLITYSVAPVSQNVLLAIMLMKQLNIVYHVIPCVQYVSVSQMEAVMNVKKVGS
jgi:hypothetical protein